MYIKVHSKGNQWFRDDGTLVGQTHISDTGQVFIKGEENLLIAYCGYLDENSSFVPFCRSITCNYDCLCERKPKCRYTYKTDNSVGYYIVSD